MVTVDPTTRPVAAPTRLPRSAPEAVGVRSDRLLGLVEALDAGPEVHSLMVVTRGAVVAEGWWAPYRPDLPHQLFSLSKTFTAIAVGLAESEGLLSIDDLVLDHLGDRGPADPDANLAAMRLRHLLTMTTGHHDDTSDRVFDEHDWVRAFLALPVEHEPGTHFVYNTAATYILSAVVQQVTGQRLLDYLTPRLLEPLGIVGATWEQCPMGVDTGGFGLAARTEDLARLGALLLADGVHQGRRLLPAGWVAEAARVHTPSTNENPDWRQGYGYQMWRGRHGSFRGDGAFGQFCVVLPEQQTVVAMTGGTMDMQGVLDILWAHLLPALEDVASGARPADAEAAARLTERLTGLHLDPPTGPEPAGTWRAVMEPNDAGLREVRVRTEDGATVVSITTQDHRHTIRAGHATWLADDVALPWFLRRRSTGGERHVPVVASVVGIDAGGVRLTLRPLETPVCADLRLAVDGQDVLLTGEVTVAFGPTGTEPVRGRLVPDGADD